MSGPNVAANAAELVIIGAGVLGATIAVSAARRGLRTVVIDQNPSAGFGSTSASAGIIRVHAGDVDGSVLALESVSAWRNWRDFAQVPAGEAAAEFVQCGTMVLEDSMGTLDRISEVMRESGAEFSELDGDALAGAIPWADTRRFGPPALPESEQFWRDPDGRIERAIHTSASGYVADPALAAQNLADLARRLGVRFVMGQRVVGSEQGSGDAVRLRLANGDRIEARNVVNVAGPSSIRVNETLGVGGDFRVGQRLVRHELHHVEMSEPQKVTAHIVDGDLGINFRPEGTSGFLVGGSGDPIDGEEVVDAPEEFTSFPTRESWYRQAGRAARRIPSLVLSPKPRGVVGLYDVTDDWLPIFDRTDRPGVFVAIGTSGNQFKTAPIVGELMLDVIMANLEGGDTDRDPVTSELPSTGRSVDMSVFSRLRTPRLGGSRG